MIVPAAPHAAILCKALIMITVYAHIAQPPASVSLGFCTQDGFPHYIPVFCFPKTQDASWDCGAKTRESILDGQKKKSFSL